MKEFVAKKSKAQGLPVSRLPQFTEAEKCMIKGKSWLLNFSLLALQCNKCCTFQTTKMFQ